MDYLQIAKEKTEKIIQYENPNLLRGDEQLKTSITMLALIAIAEQLQELNEKLNKVIVPSYSADAINTVEGK